MTANGVEHPLTVPLKKPAPVLVILNDRSENAPIWVAGNMRLPGATEHCGDPVMIVTLNAFTRARLVPMVSLLSNRRTATRRFWISCSIQPARSDVMSQPYGGVKRNAQASFPAPCDHVGEVSVVVGTLPRTRKPKRLLEDCSS